MAKFAINPTGLKVKPTYESQIEYIANQPTIAYPDRGATFAARSMKANQLFEQNAAQMAEQKARMELNQMNNSAARGLGGAMAPDASSSGGMRIPRVPPAATAPVARLSPYL